MSFSTRIKALRKAENLTQKEFAKRLCISQSYLSGLENGNEAPADRLVKLIELEFNVSSDWLATGNGEMYSPYCDYDRGYQSEFSNRALMDILIALNTDSNARYSHITSILTATAGLIKLQEKINNSDSMDYLEKLAEFFAEFGRLADIIFYYHSDSDSIDRGIKIINDLLHELINTIPND